MSASTAAPATGLSANRAAKANEIDEIAGSLGKAPYAFLIDFKGLNVPDVTEFRRKVRASGSEYVVVKNTLAVRALRNAPLGQLAGEFKGMTGVAYSATDVVGLAKVLHGFAKTHPALKVKAALVDGQVVSAKELEALASMPTRTELVAKLLGLMQSPVRRLVTVLSGPQRNLAITLSAVAKQKEESAA